MKYKEGAIGYYTDDGREREKSYNRTEHENRVVMNKLGGEDHNGRKREVNKY
jgi:hypothetical protein